MEVKISTQDHATIVSITGNLDGNSVNEAQDKIIPLVNGKTSLVLDLKGCGYISSAGLRLLLMAAKQLSTQNCMLVLSGVSAEIQDVMEMTGFSNFFKSFGSVADALAALKNTQS